MTSLINPKTIHRITEYYSLAVELVYMHDRITRQVYEVAIPIKLYVLADATFDLWLIKRVA